MNAKPTTMNDASDYFAAKSIRSAIATEIARRVHVSEEMIAAKQAADDAVSKYREVIRLAVRDQFER